MKISLLLLLVILSTHISGQHIPTPFPYDKDLYRENLSIQANDNRFIPGERILFSLNNRLYDNRWSFISKICYLELIDGDKGSILRSKVKINNGHGQGHLYLPSYLKSGNYTLIAYTSWMLNYPRAYIPQFPIEIINPYNPIAGHLIKDSLGMAFRPVGGSYVIGAENAVVYEFDLPPSMNPNSRLNIKIFDKDGVERSAFIHQGSKNQGEFQFNPPSKGDYKIIATDQNDRIYYGDLMVNKTSKFSISQSLSGNQALRIINRSGVRKTLSLKHRSSPFHDQTVRVIKDTLIYIDQLNWPSGYSFAYFDKTDIGTLIYLNDPNNSSLSVKTDKSAYGKREEVKLTIKDDRGSLDYVSVSVKKQYDKSFRSKYFSSPKSTNLTAQSLTDFDDIYTLPDYRSQLIYGQLDSAATSEVSLSPVGGVPTTSLARADGSFLVPLSDYYQSEDWKLLSAIDQKAKVREAYLEDHYFVEVDSFIYRGDITSWLESKSIDVQIENAYLKFQSDSITVSNYVSPMKAKINKTYLLDDYLRFPSIGETIIEIVTELRVRNRNGISEFIIPYIDIRPGFSQKAMILLDGIPVSAEDMLKVDPLGIKKIELAPENLKIGTQEYQGILFFTSYDADASLLNVFPGYSDVDILPLQPKMSYYGSFEKELSNTIPDHRSQVYWNPDFNLKKDDAILFSTSDLLGSYEIVVQGIDLKGQYVIAKTTFEVK